MRGTGQYCSEGVQDSDVVRVQDSDVARGYRTVM